jgi:hypothetical protein
MSSLFSSMVHAQQQHQQDLLRRAGVVGVGVGYRESQGGLTDELALVALVEQKKPLEALSASELIPREMGGMKTDVQAVGKLRALQLTSPKGRFRPTIAPGVSIGHYLITAGTLGAVVYDRATGEAFLLSNNHVFANSNEASLGDPILQPGPLDQGLNPSDTVATLARWVQMAFHGDPTPVGSRLVPPPSPVPPTEPDEPDTPVEPDPPVEPEEPLPDTPGTPDPVELRGCSAVGWLAAFAEWLARANQRPVPGAGTAQAAGTATPVVQETPITHPRPVETFSASSANIPDNRVDAALARPITPAMFDAAIRHIGPISGATRPTLGLPVRKAGRTTDYTEGTITLVNATVDVAYLTSSGERKARFTGQMIATPMSQGGDSGSLIVARTSGEAVGLLFAGSAQATIFTPIDEVLDALGVRF